LAAADVRVPGPGDVAADDPADEPEASDGGAYEGPEYEPAKPADQEDPEDSADSEDRDDPDDRDGEGRVDVPDAVPDCDEA
jgi:hypothetical protein